MFQTWKVLPDSLLVQFHCFVSSAHQCTEKGGGGDGGGGDGGGGDGGGGDGGGDKMGEEEMCCMPVLVMSLACPGNESGLSWE